jgi:hypothetical protein
VADDFDDLLARATKDRCTPVALLDALATTELEDRARRSLERRLRRARLGRFTPMAERAPHQIRPPLAARRRAVSGAGPKSPAAGS